MKLVHKKITEILKGSKSKKPKVQTLSSLFIFALFFTTVYTAVLTPVSITTVFTKIFSAKTALADTIDDLQKKIDERNANIEQLNREIQTYSDLTDKTSQQALSLQKVIKDLEANAKYMDLDIKRLKAKIDVANLDIKRLDINIDQSKAKIEKLQEGISSSIREIQRSENFNLVENLLGQRNISDFLSQIDSQFSLNAALQTKISDLRNEKQSLETNKGSKETQKENLVKMQTEIANKKKVVEYDKAEQAQALKESKNQEKTFQKILL